MDELLLELQDQAEAAKRTAERRRGLLVLCNRALLILVAFNTLGIFRNIPHALEDRGMRSLLALLFFFAAFAMFAFCCYAKPSSVISITILTELAVWSMRDFVLNMQCAFPDIIQPDSWPTIPPQTAPAYWPNIALLLLFLIIAFSIAAFAAMRIVHARPSDTNERILDATKVSSTCVHAHMQAFLCGAGHPCDINWPHDLFVRQNACLLPLLHMHLHGYLCRVMSVAYHNFLPLRFAQYCSSDVWPGGCSEIKICH